MSAEPTLSISFAGLDADASETPLAYKIDVTHLATRITTPDMNRGLRDVSPGLKLVLASDGAVDLVVDTETFRLSPGVALAVDGNAPVGISRTDEPEDLSEPPALHIIEFNAWVGDTFPLQSLLDLPLLLGSGSADTLSRLFEQLTFGEAATPLPPGDLDISRHVAAITLISVLLKASGESSDPRDAAPGDDRVPRLRQFLFENMGRSVEVPEMAQHLGMSRASFFRWSKEALGCSPLKYLRTMRLERSQEWIAQDAGTLEEIASQTGFSDSGHLGREFKKHFGMTPAQYRKTARSSPEADFLARAAERYFSHGRFDEALAACEQCIKSNPPSPVIDRARYQKGLCLRALGRRQEAVAEWQALKGTGFSHRAGIQECREAFNMGSTDRALALLRVLYANANQLQKQDLVNVWMDHVRALIETRDPQQLRQYLALRKRRFRHDMHSSGLAVNALRMLGDNLEILEQCGDLTVACYNALRRAGLYDEAVERYGTQVSPNVIAQGAFLQGRYEDVLATGPEDPRRRAEALVALGRQKEAIERYPEHSASAYLALGRYEELLERFPPGLSDAPRVKALVALGRTDEIDALVDDPASIWNWLEAQLFIRPEAVLESGHRDAYRFADRARLLMALGYLSAGNRLEAEAVLEQIDGIRSPDLWWYAHDATELLVVSLLRGMLGYPDELRDDLEEMVANHKYKDKQAMWHDAAYLSGKITAAEFRNQPQQKQIRVRLDFIQAVANDLKGRRNPACKGYEEVLRVRRPFETSELMRQRFAQWRLQEL